MPKLGSTLAPKRAASSNPPPLHSMYQLQTGTVVSDLHAAIGLQPEHTHRTWSQWASRYQTLLLGDGIGQVLLALDSYRQYS
jgi:hypothetical protein